jgi:hypothetical protein
MTESKTSSATKLYQLLHSACACDGSISTAVVWQQVLQFDPTHDRTIEGKYIEFIKLFSCVRNDLEEITGFDSKIEKYLVVLDSILSILFTVPFNSQWNPAKSRISLISLQLLDSCGDWMIASGKALNEPSQEKIDGILSDVQDLICTLEESTVDVNFKCTLIKKLKKIEIALHHNKVFGVIELKQVTEQSLGEMLIIAEQLPKNDVPEIIRDNIVKMIDVLSKCNSVYTLGEKIAPHLNHITHNLPNFANSMQHLLTNL